MTVALITGATAGIGHEFAKQLAERGTDLVLVARNEARLEEVAKELRAAYGVAVEVLPADLADREQVQRVANRLADAARPVDVLVNNAGFGLKKTFLVNDIAVEEELFDVLCRAVLVLSHAAVGPMIARGYGQIINVSSVAGFIASGTYSAAKAYVTVFTEGLAAQVAGTGVTAMALCPGYTRTEFHDRAKLRVDSMPDRVWLSVQKLVSDALVDVEVGRVVSIPGVQYKVAVAALKVMPRSLLRRLTLVGRGRKGS